MSIIKSFVNMASAICLVLIILYVSVMTITFNSDFYEYEYNKNNVYKSIKIEQNELKKVTKHMLDYLKNKNDNIQISTIIDSEKRSFFSEKEIFHMKDVKEIFLNSNILRNVAIIVLILTILYNLKENNIVNLLKLYRNVFLTIIIIFTFFIFMVSINFEKAFIIFHEIFFSNDLYLLDPNIDLLINIVPTRFFIDISILIGILLFLFMFIIVFLCNVFIKFKKLRSILN